MTSMFTRIVCSVGWSAPAGRWSLAAYSALIRRLSRRGVRGFDLLCRSAVIACLIAGGPRAASAAITGLTTSGQNTYVDGEGYTRDSSWSVVGVPDLSGDNSVPWSPPDGQTVPYDAYRFQSIPGNWIGAVFTGSGPTNFGQAGVAVPNGTAYWVGANFDPFSPTGVSGGGVAGQRDTAYKTTFVNTGSAGNYRMSFVATGDNFISIYANGSVVSSGTNRFTVSGGNQIGNTEGNFTTLITYDSIVPLTSGTNDLFVIIGDQGGLTGMLFGGFSEPEVLAPYWAPSTGAGGTQTWNTTDSFWAPNADGSGTKDTWGNTTGYNYNAFFGGTPGTVTASGTLNVNTMNLTTSGYNFVGGATDRINFFTYLTTGPAIKLSSGVTGTMSTNLSGGSGNFYAIDITGTGSAGTLVYAGTSSMTGAYGMTYNVTNARLVLDGRLTANGNGGSINLASNASLLGSGSTNGTILGAGLVNPGGTGTSSGILTAQAVNPGTGLDFTFVFSGTAPNYANASDSTNDVLRLTGGTPFASTLTTANTKTLFLNFTKEQLLLGEPGAITELAGGFFTDAASDFTSLLNNQTWNNGGFQVYVLGDGQGTNNSLNGQGYYNWRNPAMFGWDQSLFLSTRAESADFGGGTVNGQVMLLTIAVPEPSTWPLGLAGVVALGGLRRVRRRC